MDVLVSSCWCFATGVGVEWGKTTWLGVGCLLRWETYAETPAGLCNGLPFHFHTQKCIYVILCEHT